MAKKIGNAPDAPGEAENTGYNHNAVKSAAQSTKTSEGMCTSYSIQGKKRKGYMGSNDQQGD